MPAEELPEPLLHSGDGVARPKDQQVLHLKVVKELPKVQLILGVDLLILAVAWIGNRSDTAAREDLFARAQVDGVAHTPDVSANSADMTAKNRRLRDSRQTRSASEK
jgi:hypothetical protein